MHGGGGLQVLRLAVILVAVLTCCFAGTVTLTPVAYTFGEDEIRVGGVRFTLTLTGDTWAAGQQAAVVAGLQGSGTDPNGWNSRRDLITTPSSSSGTVMVISVGPDSLFDTSVVDDVVIDIPASSVTSNTKPVSSGGQLKVTIQPVAGTLSFELLVNNILNTGRTVTEEAINTGSVPVAIRLTLDRGETWKVIQDNDDRLSMLEGMDGALSVPEAWDDRKTVIIPDSSSFSVSTDGQVLTVQFTPDSLFDVASQEDVTVSLPGPSYPSTLFLTNLKPSGQPWGYSITPSPSVVTIVPSPLSTDEDTVRRGGFTFSLQLSGWEKWIVPIDIPTLQAAMVSSSSEANGFNARKATLIQSATPQSADRTLQVVMSADPLYDIANTEQVAITIPSSMLQSGLQPTSSSTSLTITPLTGSWDLTLVKGGSTMTEDEIRAGGQRLILELSGDTWSGSGCSAIIAAITSNIATPTGFSSRKSTIAPASSCTATGNRMEIGFVGDSQYDISSAENLQISVPATAVSSGLVPTPTSKQLVILPSTGSVILSPQTFTEDELVSGTAVITVELTGGETWALGQQDNIMRSLVALTDPPNGFNARKNTIINPSNIVISGQTVTIPVGTDSVFDISEQQTVEMQLGGFLFQSSMAPSGTPSFTITAVRGRVLPVPIEFGESALRRGGFEVDLTLLDSRETWINDASVGATLLASLSAPLAEPFGFAARKDRLVSGNLVSFDPSKQNATVRLTPDVEYDITANETVTLALAPGMFASGLVPNPVLPLAITIYPEAAIVSLDDMPCLSEDAIRTGTAQISLLLSEGETWKDIPAVAAAFAGPGSGGSPTGFDSRKSVILPNDGSSIQIDPVNPQRLVVSFRADSVYDVVASEDIIITIPGSAVASGIEPVPNPNPGWTSPLKFCIGPATTNVTVTDQVFTEVELRQGGACLTMELGLGETWEPIDRSAWTSSMNSDNSVQPLGWDARKTALIPSTTSIAGSMNVMCFAADALFDITQNETVSVTIPPEAVSSMMPPAQPFRFTVQVVTGLARLAPPTSFEESIVRLGGARITILLEDETWLDPPSAPQITAGFSCSGNESQGFNARKNVLLTSASYRVNAQELRVHLSQDNIFDISESEECIINLPGSTTPSGLAPSGILNFTIEPSFVYNVAGNASFTDAEIRTGSAVLDIALDNDQWAASGELLLIAGFNSDRTIQQEPNGFNSRKASLLPVSALQFVNDHLLRVTLQADPFFISCQKETVIIDVPAAVVQSGRKPTVLPRGFNLTLTISPTAKAVVDFSTPTGTSSSGNLNFNETQLREGEVSFSLTIIDGNWSQNAADLLLMSSTGSLNNSASWDGWKMNMFNSIISGTTLTLIAKPTPLYDIPSTEIVEFNIPNEVVGCGALRASSPLTITVTPTPGIVSIDCSKGLLFTDWEVREGLISLTLTLVGDTWTTSFGELAAGMVSNSTFPTGFSGLRSQLLLVPGSFSASQNVLNITMQPVSQYRVDETEEVFITLPNSMLLSGIAPTVDGCPLQFAILPGRGRISASPAFVTDDMIRTGGFILSISMVGDNWDTNLNKANFISNWVVLNDSSPSGFDVNRADMFQLPDAVNLDSTSAQILEIIFSPAKSYLITSEEELQLFVVSDSVVGKKPPLDSPISLMITLGNDGIRFAPTGSLFTAPDQARTLDGGTVVPDIVVELIDSKGNRDTTLTRSFVTVTPKNSAVKLNDTRAPIVQGVATFSNLLFLTYPSETILLFEVDSSAGVTASNKQLQSGLVTVLGSSTPIPSLLPPTPGTPFGSLNVILAPIPFIDSCNASVIIDASLTTNPANELFVWTTMSNSVIVQLQVSTFSGPRVAVDAAVLSQEIGSHEICVTVGTETACQILEVRGSTSQSVMMDTGSTIHIAASDPVVIRSYPIEGTGACDDSNRDLSSAYSYSWVSDDGMSLSSASSSQLRIPPNTLTPGSAYGFTVTACPQGSNVCKKGRVIVYATWGLLSAGASVDALYLTSSGEPPVSVKIFALRNYLPVDTPYSSSWECVKCASGGGDFSGSGDVFRVSRGDLNAGTHDVVISVTHNGEISHSMITITAASTSGPGAVMRSVGFPGVSVIDSTVSYSLIVYTTSSSSNLSAWDWSVAPTANDGITTTNSVFMAPGVLSGSTTYSVSAELGTTVPSFSRKLLTHPLPSGGSCSVTPDSGVPNQDRHQISCSGWTVAKSADNNPPFQSTTLEYRYTRVTGTGTGSREQDLSGGWRRSSYFSTQLMSYSDSQSAQLVVYIRPLYSKGMGIRVTDLTVNFVGSPSGNVTTSESALQNGDLELAATLAFDEIYGKSGASYQQVASLASMVLSEGQINQLLGFYCAMSGITNAGDAVVDSLMTSLSMLVNKLSAMTTRSADSRRCSVSGAGKLMSLLEASPDANGTVPASINGRGIALVHNILSLGSQDGSQESYSSGKLAISYYGIVSSGGIRMMNTPFRGQSSGSQTIIAMTPPASSTSNLLYSYGVSDWTSYPAGEETTLKVDGFDVNHVMASHVVGVVVQTVEGIQKLGDFDITMEMLSSDTDTILGHRAAYFSPAGEWLQDGVTLNGINSGLASFTSTHLTDFAVFSSAYTPQPPGSSSDDDDLPWWVWLFVALSICLCCLIAIYCIYVYQTKKRKKKAGQDTDSNSNSSDGRSKTTKDMATDTSGIVQPEETLSTVGNSVTNKGSDDLLIPQETGSRGAATPRGSRRRRSRYDYNDANVENPIESEFPPQPIQPPPIQPYQPQASVQLLNSFISRSPSVEGASPSPSASLLRDINQDGSIQPRIQPYQPQTSVQMLNSYVSPQVVRSPSVGDASPSPSTSLLKKVDAAEPPPVELTKTASPPPASSDMKTASPPPVGSPKEMV